MSSNSWAWSSLYISLQREAPFEDTYEAVDDQLIILHLDGPVTVHGRVRNGENSRLVPAGGLFMIPGGMDFGVRLGGPLLTLHLYLRRALIQEVTQSIQAGDPAKVELLPRIGDNDPLIERLMLGVCDAMRDDGPTAEHYVDYLGRAIAARLVRGYSSSSPAEHAAVRLGCGQLGKAIDFMQAHLQDSTDLSAIAGAACLSPSHFARQFRATMGTAPISRAASHRAGGTSPERN